MPDWPDGPGRQGLLRWCQVAWVPRPSLKSSASTVPRVSIPQPQASGDQRTSTRLDCRLKMQAVSLLFLAALSASVSAVTTTLPKSAGVETYPTAIPVTGSYDGGMKRFERSRKRHENDTAVTNADTPQPPSARTRRRRARRTPCSYSKTAPRSPTSSSAGARPRACTAGAAARSRTCGGRTCARTRRPLSRAAARPTSRAAGPLKPWTRSFSSTAG